MRALMASMAAGPQDDRGWAGGNVILSADAAATWFTSLTPEVTPVAAGD